jgi:hypothetical protein
MKKHVGKLTSIRAMLRLSCVIAFLIWPAALNPLAGSEYDVEAAYLLNFGKFVQWPADVVRTETSFDICILGQDPFNGKLQNLVANERMDGKPIHDRSIVNTTEEEGCSIIYVAESEEAHLAKTVATFDRRGELLVSGLPHFLDNGGTIQFVIERHRVRFEVNLDSASKDGLILSSELLKVAVSVTGKPQSGAVQ